MVTAKFTKFPLDSNWCNGIVEDSNNTFIFESKLFDDGSTFGINNGRVSKLHISKNNRGRCIVNYDRGWDVEPTEENRKYFNAVMELLENAPKRF